MKQDCEDFRYCQQRRIASCFSYTSSRNVTHSYGLVQIIMGGAAWCSRYSDSLQAGRFGGRIPVEARFSTPVQTGPGAHPASCTIGQGGSFPGLSGRGMALTNYSTKHLCSPLCGPSGMLQGDHYLYKY
jgi:hypothetical protein